MLVLERSDPTHSSWGFGVLIKPRQHLLWVKYMAGKNMQFQILARVKLPLFMALKPGKADKYRKKSTLFNFFFFWQEIQPNKANTNSTSQGIRDCQACLLTCSPFTLAKHTQKNPIKWPQKFKFIFWGQLLGLLPGQTASAIPADEQRAAVPGGGLVVLKERRKKITKLKPMVQQHIQNVRRKTQLKPVHS